MDTVTYHVYKTENIYESSLVLQDIYLELGNVRQHEFKFYGVNPAFRPIPTGMVVFSVKQNSIGTASADVRLERNPPLYENYEKDRTYLLVWLYKLPDTIPIYVAYSPSKQLVKIAENPFTKLDSTFTQTWKWYTVSMPTTKFKLEQQICVPTNLGGMNLKACTGMEIINPTILRYVSTYKKFPEGVEKRAEYYVIGILLVMIFFAYIIKNVYNRYRVGRG